jgi:hypothetical protein
MRTQSQPAALNTHAAHLDSESEANGIRTSDPRWVDRLVELHVLAEHGDTASAAEAEEWIATDAKARQMWESVEHVRDQLQR